MPSFAKPELFANYKKGVIMAPPSVRTVHGWLRFLRHAPDPIWQSHPDFAGIFGLQDQSQSRQELQKVDWVR